MSNRLTLADHELSLTINRYPEDKRGFLQAWDAADEYIARWWKEHNPATAQSIWVLNDGFGALSCFCLSKGAKQVTAYSDSHISQLATQKNVESNQLDSSKLRLQDCLSDWVGIPDLILLKLPKSVTLLEHQLARLSMLPANIPIVIAGRIKDMPSRCAKVTNHYLGSTAPSLAWKKARLLFATTPGISQPAPKQSEWSVPELQLSLSHHANVYSRNKLDPGAAFLLQHLPHPGPGQQVIDLGCGNGVLSLAMAKQQPEANYLLVDESHMAIASANDNQQRNLPSLSSQFRFMVNNCLDGLEPGQADLVVCNPPFHQQQAITDHIAWQMFNDAKSALKPGGKLLVVGNRHLGYHIKLNKVFGNCRLLASNPKFVILEAVR